MNFFLLDVYQERNLRVSKDTNGGYGTVNDYGGGLVSRFLSRIKKSNVDFPSLTLSYTVAALKKQGHRVSYGRNSMPPPDTEVVLLLSSIVEHSAELEWGRLLKGKGFHVGYIGSFARMMKDSYLAAGDFVVDEEAEFFFLTPVTKEKLRGVVSSGASRLSLDDLPFPDWSLFQKKNLKYGLYGAGTSFFPMLATRGCPFSCRYYCTYPLGQGTVVRFRSPKNIVDEIERLIKEYGAQTILFRDPVFGINRGKTVELLEEIIRRDLKIKFVIETHLSLLDEEMIKLFSRAGLITVKVGIEAADSGRLESYHRKDVNRSSELETIRKLERAGIGVICFYILAFPTDTWDSCVGTIKHAVMLNTIGAQFSVCTPYPGTAFYDAIKDRITAKKFDDFTQFNLVYKHDHLTPLDVDKLMSLAYNKYYSRPSWAFKYISHRIKNRFLK